MKRVLFLIFVTLITMSIKAQHIAYADFMKLVKIEKWSEMNNALTTKGYKFAGSRNVENTDRPRFQAIWCRNCTYNLSTNEVRWETNVSHSIFFANRYSDRSEYVLGFSGKQAFDTFLKTAKANGFKYKNEEIFPECIAVWYTRINKKTKKTEVMKLNQFTDSSYELLYYIE